MNDVGADRPSPSGSPVPAMVWPAERARGPANAVSRGLESGARPASFQQLLDQRRPVATEDAQTVRDVSGEVGRRCGGVKGSGNPVKRRKGEISGLGPA